MKKIGIIGGLGPEATVDYYRIIIDVYRKKTKGSFPAILIYSLNMKEFSCMIRTDQSKKVARWLINAANSLDKAGADFCLIASNTPHIVFKEVSTAVNIPMLSIVEETCKVAVNLGLTKVGLLGTRTTMAADFYQRKFEKNGIAVIAPNECDQDYIHKKLVTEIMFNKILKDTKEGLLKIVKKMIDTASIQAVILGCTELPLILTEDEFGIPFLNTTRIHAESAVHYCLQEE